MNTEKLVVTKGEVVNMNQEAGEKLKKIKVAAGWDVARRDVDLDLSCLIFNDGNTKIGHVYFNDPSYAGGAIKSSGDNRTGKGDGDDETLFIDFEKLPADASKILVTINSYTGQTLDIVKNAFARVVNDADNTELLRYELNQFGPSTGVFMALLTKTGDNWNFKGIGEAANGATIADMVPAATQHLG